MTTIKKYIPILVAGLLFLPGHAANAQVVNCALYTTCIDSTDKPAVSAGRTLCREDAMAGDAKGLNKYSVGVLLQQSIVDAGGGPPLDAGCPLPGSSFCQKTDTVYSCIGINQQPVQ